MMQKQTEGKLRLDLIPPRAEEAIAKVRAFGVTKYKEEWAWKEDVPASEFITAAQRHIRSHRAGEGVDPESNLPHIWHALTSLAMAVEIMPDDETLNRFDSIKSWIDLEFPEEELLISG